MLCPFCNTENRDDQELCYKCNKDLSMLRLIINKAKHHYNLALEHAERGRYYEAITELNNVLELDSKNVNAFVVLGTIYAKQNHFDKAIECWEKALNIDNRFLKAHDYIIKAGHIKGSLPLLKWLKILAATLFASFCIIIILIVLFNKPDKRITYLNEAYKDLKSDNLINARKTLQKIESSKKDTAINISKDLLENALKNEIELAKAKIQLAIKSGQPYEAIKLIISLKSKKPDMETISWVEVNEKNIIQSIITQLNRNLDIFESEDGNPEEISNSIEIFRSSFPNNKDGKEIYQRFVNILTKNCQKELDIIYNKYLEDDNIVEAETGIKDLIQKYHKYKDINKITEATLNKIYAEQISRLIKSCQTALQKNEIEKAEALINSIEEIKNVPKDKLEIILELKSSINSRQAEKIISDIKKESASKNYEKVIELAKQAESFKLIEQDKKEIEAERQKAVKGLTLQLLKWYESLDWKFEECRQSIDESKKAIEKYPYMLENLNRKSYSYAFDNLLFYVISSHYRLGDFEKGDELAKQFETEYPKSSLLKNLKSIRKKAESIKKK